jgi:hypothetical protein
MIEIYNFIKEGENPKITKRKKSDGRSENIHSWAIGNFSPKRREKKGV